MNQFPERFQQLLQPFSGLFTVVKRTALVVFIVWLVATVLPANPLNAGAPGALGWIRSCAALLLLRAMEHSLVPAGVSFIVIGPFDAFLAIMEVGLLIGLVAGIPYFTFGVVRWLSPGMTGAERRGLRRLMALVGLLFLGGAVVALWVVLPVLYEFSYQLSPVAGAETTLSLLSFVETTLTFVIGIGIAFEIPAVCFGLARLQLLTAEVFEKRWNLFPIIAFGIAFLISPGVSGGGIEILLGCMFTGLFGLSYVIVRRVEKNRRMMEVRAPSFA